MAPFRTSISRLAAITMTVAAGLSSFEAAARIETYSARIAQGIVAIARNGQSHDPRELAKWLGIILRNPNKWLEQPEGTFRVARWKDLQNGSGISTVELTDVPVAEGKKIASTADLTFTGTRCVSVRSIERAAGIKATYGGMAYQIVMDAPSPPPTQLGREHAMITLSNTTIVILADKPGPAGCLVNLSFERTRTATAGR